MSAGHGSDHNSEGPFAGKAGFFRSRWVDPPAGTQELDPSNLAPGFRAAGLHCGLKGSGKTDLGLVAATDSVKVSSALYLTRNAAAAAPVRVCRDYCERGNIRAAIVNSGNANAATGEQGIQDALRMRDEVASRLELDGPQVAVAETGVIGVPLDIDAVCDAIPGLFGLLDEGGATQFAEAIMTTDRWFKACSVRCDGVTVSAQAKGAGMIEPNMATMLCFVQTDAQVPEPEAIVRPAVEASFNRITVDGQMSTNDTVLFQASGSSGKPLPEGLVEAVLLQLALEIVADGEGATRVGKAIVEGARNPHEAEKVVRAIGNSPLVKTALLGRDPNWGRIAQAAGMALAGDGSVPELGLDQIDATGLASDDPEPTLKVDLGLGDAQAHLFFSDLTHEYISINAEYTT